MSIVVYQCTICNRQISLQQNPKGFERVDRCTITNQCRGKLYKLTEKAEYVTGKIPDAVPGLQDWVPRKVFFAFRQNIAATVWTIAHNLDTNPAIQVYTKPPGSPSSLVPIEMDPTTYTIKFIDSNTIQLTFLTPYIGTAHCIARSTSNKNTTFTPIVTTNFVQITSSYAQPNEALGDLVIGIKGSLNDGGPTINVDDTQRVYATFLTSTNQTVNVTYRLIGGQTGSSTWSDTSRIRVGAKIYSVRSIALDGPPSVVTIDGDITDGSKFQLAGYKFKVIGQTSSSHKISLEGRQTWKFKPGYVFTVFDPVLHITTTYTTVSAAIVINTAAPKYVVSTEVVVTQPVYDSTTEFMITAPFGSDEIIALFANAPYQVVDKNIKQIINLSTLSQNDSYANIVVSQQQLVANPKIIANVYPEIKSLD